MIYVCCTSSAVYCYYPSSYGLPRYYRPPETSTGAESCQSIEVEGIPFDIWSFGLLALHIWAIEWFEDNMYKLGNHWMDDVYPLLFKGVQTSFFGKQLLVTFPLAAEFNNKEICEALNLIQSTMRYRPEDRPQASEILHHPILAETRGASLFEADEIWTTDLKAQVLNITEYQNTEQECLKDTKISENKVTTENLYIFLSEFFREIQLREELKKNVTSNLSSNKSYLHRKFKSLDNFETYSKEKVSFKKSSSVTVLFKLEFTNNSQKTDREVIEHQSTEQKCLKDTELSKDKINMENLECLPSELFYEIQFREELNILSSLNNNKSYVRRKFRSLDNFETYSKDKVSFRKASSVTVLHKMEFTNNSQKTEREITEYHSTEQECLKNPIISKEKKTKNKIDFKNNSQKIETEITETAKKKKKANLRKRIGEWFVKKLSCFHA